MSSNNLHAENYRSQLQYTKPKIYKSWQHNIDIKKIPDCIKQVINKLICSGFASYLVGGCIRDLLMGLSPKDFDIGTIASYKDIKKLFPKSILIGKKFPIMVISTKHTFVEIISFQMHNSTKSHDVNTMHLLWKDAFRRDFTLNGMFFDTDKLIILDYVNGYKDLVLKQKVTSIIPPKMSFMEDPIRILRLFKITSCLPSLSIDTNTFKTLPICKHLLSSCNASRIFHMLAKAITSRYSTSFFSLLFQYDVLPILMPSINSFMSTYSHTHNDCKQLSLAFDHYIRSNKNTVLDDCNTPGTLYTHREKLVSILFALIFEKITQHTPRAQLYYTFCNTIHHLFVDSIINIPHKVLNSTWTLIQQRQIIFTAKKSGKQLTHYKNSKLWTKDMKIMAHIQSIKDKSIYPLVCQLIQQTSTRPRL